MPDEQPGLFDDDAEDQRFDARSAEYDGPALLAEVRRLQQENARLMGRIRELMRRISTPGRCKSCGQGVLWIKYASDKNAPYDDDGQVHFATCPERDRR